MPVQCFVYLSSSCLSKLHVQLLKKKILTSVDNSKLNLKKKGN